MPRKSVLPADIRMGEFFSGPGGMALGAVTATQEDVETHGLGDARVRHVWAVDSHAASCKTYEENIGRGTGKVICGDVQAAMRGEHGELSDVDLFLFGFPCNDYSLVGGSASKGIDGNYGALYKHGIQLINRKNPLAFVAENVSGLLSSRNKPAFDKIVGELANAGDHGYVVTAHLYKLEEYGVPQSRHRIILVGIRADLGLEFRPPAPTHAGRAMTCEEALSPPIDPDDRASKPCRQHPRVEKRLRWIDEGQNIWDAQRTKPDFPDELRLKVTGAAISQIYKRLKRSEPSYTITGSGGGGTHVYHWSEDRALTNRERARLQSFPDSFKFLGSKDDMRRQIGMAVPPRAAKIIIRALLQTLDGQESLTERLENANVGVFRPAEKNVVKEIYDDEPMLPFMNPLPSAPGADEPKGIPEQEAA